MGVAHLRHGESIRRPRCPRRVARVAMIARFLHRLISADVIGLLLVVAGLQALTYGIASSLKNTDTEYFFGVCLLAVLIALGLSKLKLSGIQASAAMVALGIIGVWILAARLTVPLLDLGSAILSLTPQIIPAIRYDL